MRSRLPARRPRRAAAVVLALIVVPAAALASACASSSATAPPPSTGTTSPAPSAGPGATTGDTSLAPSTPPEQFSGALEDFYRVPDPLPAAPPGTLIRVQALATDATSATVRVMYHSRDAQDHDRAVTGVITYPTATPPDAGWPVVSWAHGTTGLTSVCAPSRQGSAAPSFGVDGVRVATDYIGLGPLGERHPYLSGSSEAHSVIDAVRAARLLPAAHAGSRWVAIGHSQGGHAALFTNELGAVYAPELTLLGTIVVAPAAVLDRTFGPDDQLVPRMVGIMALYGLAADYPEIHPDDYVGPEVAARAGVIDQKCSNDVALALVTVPPETFYKTSPVDTEPARSVLRANDPGHVRVDAPLLLVGGTADTWVVPARVAALDDQLCAIGQVTELTHLDGATHGTEIAKGADMFAHWFQDRFAGRPATDSCATTTPGTTP